MNLLGTGLLLGAALAAMGACPAAAEAAASCGGKQTAARIVEALDGGALRLADGRVVRLASVIAPLPIDGDTEAVARAKAALAEIANGKEAVIFLASETADRYGRLEANAVLLEGKSWLEAAMLARGFARVVPSAHDECVKALLQFERKGRDVRAGLWAQPEFRIFDAAGDVEALLAAAGRFVVVEGIVRRVGDRRTRLYLDFGRRFTEDFTIVVPDSVRKSLAAGGSDLKSWRGRRIRVRGILFSWGGPAIEINLAQAIELLDQDIPKSD